MNADVRPGPGAVPPWPGEPEIDLRAYGRLLAEFWWLAVLGLVLGAIAGYAIARGTHQLYVSQTSIYLGEPFSASGNIQLQSAQTNPDTVTAIVQSQAPLAAAETTCGVRPRVSVTVPAGNEAKFGQAPVVDISAYASSAREAQCAATVLARSFVDNPAVASFARAQIKAFRGEIARDEAQIARLSVRLRQTPISTAERLITHLELRPFQQDRIAALQLLQQARAVEEPRILSRGAAQRVTARSRRSSVVVAALIGLIVGGISALLYGRSRRARS